MCQYLDVERPTDEIPIPSPWDHFHCLQHGALWSRVDGNFHRCDGRRVVIKYVNPRRLPRIVTVTEPCKRLHVDELPKSPGKGLVRSILSKFAD